MHKWRPISFALAVDDFGVKHVGEEHAKHLESVLKEFCEVATDWCRRKCIGPMLDWDCNEHEAHVSLPGCMEQATKELGHETPR